jgi:hypothetical protein
MKTHKLNKSQHEKKNLLSVTISLSLLLACNVKKIENSVVAVESASAETLHSEIAPPASLSEIEEDHPTIELIIKTMTSFQDVGCSSWEELITAEKLQFIDGRFTGLLRQECLVILNDEDDCHAMDGYYITLYYKSKKDEWKGGNVFVTTHSHKIELQDFDNDGLPELICRYDGGSMGYYVDNTYVYSIKDDKMRKIYSAKGVCCAEFSLDWKKGKPVCTEYQISFIDVNNDGILEIEENKKEIIFWSGTPTEEDKERGWYLLEFSSIKTKEKSTKKILYLKNGKYK